MFWLIRGSSSHCVSVQPDIGPPEGTKTIPITHKITTETEYPDYVFYTVINGLNPMGKTVPTVTSVKLDPKTYSRASGSSPVAAGCKVDSCLAATRSLRSGARYILRETRR